MKTSAMLLSLTAFLFLAVSPAFGGGPDIQGKYKGNGLDVEIRVPVPLESRVERRTTIHTRGNISVETIQPGCEDPGPYYRKPYPGPCTRSGHQYPRPYTRIHIR